MNKPSGKPRKSLDPSVSSAVQELVSDLRASLLAEAEKISVGDEVTDDDVLLAYKRLSYPSKESIQFADAQNVISQALKENRTFEWVSYAMAVILFVFGLGVISAGLMSGDVATRVTCVLGGSVIELLILIPFRFAINSRRHNIALRMLGLIINRVDDPKKLAPLLKDTFVSVVLGNPQVLVNDK